MSKTLVGTPRPNVGPTSRRRTVALSAVAPTPSVLHLSQASPAANVEIGKWLKLVESYLQQVPRRKKA